MKKAVSTPKKRIGRPPKQGKSILEVEAEKYMKEASKEAADKEKPLTAYENYKAHAMGALIASSTVRGVRAEDIKREATSWADLMMKDY